LQSEIEILPILIIIIPFFVLIQRKESKKNQGKAERSARFALPTHSMTCYIPLLEGDLGGGYLIVAFINKFIIWMIL
jgi:hypothetical protein